MPPHANNIFHSYPAGLSSPRYPLILSGLYLVPLASSCQHQRKVITPVIGSRFFTKPFGQDFLPYHTLRAHVLPSTFIPINSITNGFIDKIAYNRNCSLLGVDNRTHVLDNKISQANPYGATLTLRENRPGWFLHRH